MWIYINTVGYKRNNWISRKTRIGGKTKAHNNFAVELEIEDWTDRIQRYSLH